MIVLLSLFCSLSIRIGRSFCYTIAGSASPLVHLNVSKWKFSLVRDISCVYGCVAQERKNEFLIT